MTDQNDRPRYLKYTPEHMHCTASFYGPLVAPNTPILAFQKVSNHEAAFRISMTGVALEQQATPEVVKKLKLVGTPTKVFKNSAFVTGEMIGYYRNRENGMFAFIYRLLSNHNNKILFGCMQSSVSICFDF